jgi:hypothetical protein
MIDIDYIRSIVEEITKQDIGRICREHEVVLARNIYFHVVKSRTGLSYAEIGRSVGKDHASVIHGIKRINEWMSYDKTVSSLYDSVIDALNEDYDYNLNLNKDKAWFVLETCRLRAMNAEFVKRNLQLREYISTLETIISKRTDYLKEAGYVEKKQRAGTGYKDKVRQQIQLERAELGI